MPYREKGLERFNKPFRATRRLTCRNHKSRLCVPWTTAPLYHVDTGTPMKRLLRSCLVLCAVAPAVRAQTLVGRNESSHTVREPLSTGERLRIASPNGPIQITRGEGREVEVRLDKSVERGGAVTDVGLIVRRTSAGLVVCAAYEDGDECDMDRGFRHEWRGRGYSESHVRAALTVRVPSGVLVTAQTGNGDVTVNGADGDVSVNTGNGRILVSGTAGRVTAHTGNGRVTVEGARGAVDANTGNGDVRVVTSSGPVNVHSGNGDIDVSMDQVARSAAMTFSTGSGRISLAVPAGFGAELDGSTGNGRIASALPVQVSGRISPQRIHGTLGPGGERLSLHTGNGDVDIRVRQ